MTFHIVQFLFFSYLLISRNMVTIIKKITLDTNSLQSGPNFFLAELKIGVKYPAGRSSFQQLQLYGQTGYSDQHL